MDTNLLQSPSIDSFSYGWLANLKPSSIVDDSSFFSFDHDEGSSFIEMDPRLPPSKRFVRVSSSSDYTFDFPVVADSPLGLVHADELISDGFIVPLFVRDRKVDPYNVGGSEYYASSSSGDATDKSSLSFSKRRCQLQRMSKRWLCKYLKFLLRPLFYGRRRGRKFERSCSSNDNATTGDLTRKWELSVGMSPRTSVAYSADDNWRRSCDSESSIHEAVLHCKRTQGN